VHIRVAHLFVAAGLLVGGAWVRFTRPDALPSLNSTPSLIPPQAPTRKELAANPASPAASSPSAPAPSTPGPGIVAVWHGHLEAPLRSLGPAPTRDLELPVTTIIPVNASRRIPVRLSRYDHTGADAGVFTGEVAGHPGGTVVLSYVGAAQAGVIYLPDEGRSYVINGGDDGRIRVTTTDLATAPGCSADLPRPPVPTL